MLPITPAQNPAPPIPIPPPQINFQVPPVPPYLLPPTNNPAIFTKLADENKNAPLQAPGQQVEQKFTSNSLPPPMFPPPKMSENSQVYQTAASGSTEVQNLPVHLPVLNNQPFPSNFNLLPG